MLVASCSIRRGSGKRLPELQAQRIVRVCHNSVQSQPKRTSAKLQCFMKSHKGTATPARMNTKRTNLKGLADSPRQALSPGLPLKAHPPPLQGQQRRREASPNTMDFIHLAARTTITPFRPLPSALRLVVAHILRRAPAHKHTRQVLVKLVCLYLSSSSSDRDIMHMHRKCPDSRRSSR